MKNEDQQSFDWRTFDWMYLVRMGVIAGLVLLYLGIIGMIATFHEREVVLDLITLGQLVMIIPSFGVGYIVARKVSETQHLMVAILAGVVVGAITSIPTLILLVVNDQTEIDAIFKFENIDNKWVEAITFDNRRELLRGSLMFFGAMVASGGVGAIFSQLSSKVRRALIWSVGFTLGVGIMGESLGKVLLENFDRSFVSSIFRSQDTLRQPPALIILVITTITSFSWVFWGRQAQSEVKLKPQQAQVARYSAYGALLVFLILLPSILGGTFSTTLVLIGLYILMGFGLNIAIGLAGLLDLGYVTNYAVGAYVAAVLTTTSTVGIGNGNFTFWMVIPIALLAAMATGFFFALPVLKMRGDYLAIATLGFGEIIGKLAKSVWLEPIIGGSDGISSIPNASFFGTLLKDPSQIYYVVLVGCIVVLFVSVRLANSRTGRQWMAIREDEDAASAMGINVARAKLLAFTLSAATGGVAGAIFAVHVNAITADSFTVFVSINVLSLIIVGGMGSNLGIVVGAIVLVGMPEFLREFDNYRFLMYGALLIYMMINRPEGLVPSQVTRRELATRQEAQESMT